MTIIHRDDNAPTVTPLDTPTPSLAPSVILDSSRPVASLPLAVRKNIRDHWHTDQPELEVRISSLLGCPWVANIDTASLYTLAGKRYAKEDPGVMFTEYIFEAINRIEEFLQEYGNDGKQELNKLASSHTIKLEQTLDPEIEYTDCEISHGCLNLLFSKGNLGVNVYRAAENLAGAVNRASQTMAIGTPGTLSFLAKHSVKMDCSDNKIASLTNRIATTLSMGGITLIPNFADNYAKLAAYMPTNYDFPRNWQVNFGASTLEYFECFANSLEELGFQNDDLLQEGFREAIYRNEIVMRVVDRLVTGDCNEGVTEHGVLYLQTVPQYWSTDPAYVAKGLVDIL